MHRPKAVLGGQSRTCLWEAAEGEVKENVTRQRNRKGLGGNRMSEKEINQASHVPFVNRARVEKEGWDQQGGDEKEEEGARGWRFAWGGKNVGREDF